jgi:tetratricopeptide (TPR) repeat protein
MSLGRLAARAAVVAFAVYAGWAGVAVVHHEWVLLAVATGVWLASVLSVEAAGLAGMGLAIYTSQTWLLAAFGLLLVPRLAFRVLPLWAQRRRTDPVVFTAAVDGLDPRLVGMLATLAGTEPISTVTLGWAAAAETPNPWHGALNNAAAAGWDGHQVLDSAGRRWTSIAAEAVILGQWVAAESEDVSVAQTRAAAALMLPEAALTEVVKSRADEIAGQITGLSHSHLVEIVTRFAGSPAGADVVRRAELRLTLDRAHALPAERLFTASNGRLWMMKFGAAVIGPVAIIFVLAGMVGKAMLSPLLGVRWLWRRVHQARPPRPGTSPARTPPWTRIEPSTLGSTSGGETPAMARYIAERKRRASRAQRLGGWLRLAAGRSSWPATLGLRVVRPVCTLTAVATVLVSGEPWWLRLLLAVSLLTVRPLRRWWLDLVLVAGAAAGGLLPLASALLVRVLVTGAVVGRWGIERSAAGPRRELISSMTGRERDRLLSPKDSWTKYLDSLGSSEDDFADGAFEYLASAWASGDGLVFIGALVTVVRIEVFDWHPDNFPAVMPSMMRRLVRLAAIEWLVNTGLRWLVALAALSTALRTTPGGYLVVGAFRLPHPWIQAAFVTLLALRAVRPAPAYAMAVGLTALDLVWIGPSALPSAAVVLAGATIARTLGKATERRTISAPARMWWVGRRLIGIRQHARFRAASLLISRGRLGIAVELLNEIAEVSRDDRPAAAATALAQCALVELDRGNLQRAVDHARAAEQLAGLGRSRTASALAAYAQGIVHFNVGDYAQAVPVLKSAEAILRRRPEGRSCASVLARAYAAVAEPDLALAAARRAAGRSTAPGQLPAIVEARVAAGWALLRSGRTAEAGDLAQSLGIFGAPFDDTDLTPDDRTHELWSRLMGETCLLLGRVHLAAGELDEARAKLREAAQHLRRTTAPDLLGMTRIYEGQCHRLRGDWASAGSSVRDGIELLESRRGQLSAGANRASAVLSGADYYDTALNILVEAQRYTGVEAGAVAASLIESLRRNAFAATLRNEQSSFIDRLSTRARDTLNRITRLELGAQLSDDENPIDELERLRKSLDTQVSQGFARAYFPEEVDYQRLSSVAHGAHILQFELLEVTPERWRGYRVWVRSSGTLSVEEIAVTDPRVLLVLDAARRGDYAEALFAPFDEMMDVWAAVAKAVLPAEMIKELRYRPAGDPIRLLIVPGEHLAYLPWAPLLLDPADEQQMLLHKAVIQVVPSLTLLRPSDPPPAQVKILAYLDSDATDQVANGGRDAAAWHRLSAAMPTELVHSRDEFEQHLSDRTLSGIHLIAHGEGTGLAQGIQFSVGGVLSAASALRFRWPRSMVFASCFVAKVEQQTGREPLGLVIACMLGGCRTVIGGVIKVERLATGDIAANTSIALAGAIEPAEALRNAQRAFLDHEGTVAFTNEWAGLICISTDWRH